MKSQAGPRTRRKRGDAFGRRTRAIQAIGGMPRVAHFSWGEPLACPGTYFVEGQAGSSPHEVLSHRGHKGTTQSGPPINTWAHAQQTIFGLWRFPTGKKLEKPTSRGRMQVGNEVSSSLRSRVFSAVLFPYLEA